MPGRVVRADRSCRLALAILLALAGGLLGSCSSAPGSPASPPSLRSTRHASAQVSLDAVVQAVKAHDRPAFDRQISARDPDFSLTAARIYRNLVALRLSSLSIHLQPLDGGLTGARRALFGSEAFVAQVALTWRLVGDVGPAQQLIWMTFVPDGSTTAIAATTDGPAGQAAQPLWLTEALTTLRRGVTTVLAGPGRSSSAWLRSGDAAAAAVRSRLHAGLGAHWNGQLVLELPSTRRAFEQVLGVRPGSYAQIAAVAWPEGPDPGTAAVRIVVNPELTDRLDQQTLEVLLTHEATHVATRSAVSPAPTWLVEGFADYVAYDAYPRTAGRAAAAVLAQVRSHGTPSGLPANAEFSPAAANLDLRYAESWLACRFLATTFSPAALDRFYAAVDSGTTVDDALRSVFGLSERDFTSSWAASLRRAAQQSHPYG